MEKDKKSIIDEIVYDYLKNKSNVFKYNIIIKYKYSIDYSKQKQTIIYQKARDTFNRIQKKTFVNQDEKIYDNNKDISESINKVIINPSQKKLMNEHIAIFLKLDKIIERGILISVSINDNKSRLEYSNYKYYISSVIINDIKYLVEFDTRLSDKSCITERHFVLKRLYKV